MESKQKAILVLLIVAIVFSIASLALSLSLSEFKIVKSLSNSGAGPIGKSSGEISLHINPPTPASPTG